MGRRVAVQRFGVCAALLAGCWRDAPIATTPPEQRPSTVAPAQRRDIGLLGAYWCSIEDQGYAYPKFPCVISRRNAGGVELAKLGGSQRFVGQVFANADGGFAFAGKFFCPWGACDSPLTGNFERGPSSTFRGTFTDNSIVVTLEPAEDTAFAGYGGDSYGGASYAGNSPNARPIRARP
jgi:hypothetical protein